MLFDNHIHFQPTGPFSQVKPRSFSIRFCCLYSHILLPKLFPNNIFNIRYSIFIAVSIIYIDFGYVTSELLFTYFTKDKGLSFKDLKFEWNLFLYYKFDYLFWKVNIFIFLILLINSFFLYRFSLFFYMHGYNFFLIT